MNCIIVDDEYKSIALLKGYISEVQFLKLENTFRNPVEALTCLETQNIDLVFLDINMPRLSGLELLRSVRKKPIVIFTTAYSHHALEGYELDVIDYLLKPITFERFLKAVNKAQGVFHHKNPTTNDGDTPFILIPSGPQIHQVRKEDILFVEKDGNYATIHTPSKKIIARQSFDEISQLLNSDRFVRAHKSFIVSLDHVTLIETHQVTVHSHKIPIGAAFRDEFMKRLQQRKS